MKIVDLLEIRSTQDLTSHGIDLTKFGERVLLSDFNGRNIYIRRTTDNSEWLLDIDEKALVFGQVSESYKGKIKNKLFVMTRYWTDPDARNQGLVSTILFCLFNKMHFALMCDQVLSPSGKALWMKLCKQLSITNCYKIDRALAVYELINKHQLINNITNDDDDTQYIIEYVVPSQLHEILGGDHMVTDPGWLQKYDFEDCM